MEYWQIALLSFFVLIPFALMLDFWPQRERLNYRGQPVEREWIRQIEHAPADEDHH